MSEATLKQLIEEVKIAMFTTLDEEGRLRSRPLATLDILDESELCFFTNEEAPKVDEIAHERQVNLAYSDPKAQRYVSVSGTARVTQDREEIARFWKPLHKAWFPKGVDDPAIAVIHVKITKAEYWDTPSSAVVHAIGLAKSLLTGKTYDPGDHEKLSMPS